MCKDLSDVAAPGAPQEIAVKDPRHGESRSRARGGVGYAHRWRIEEDEGEPGEIPAEG
jgi:hypothetical protein